MMKHIHKLVCVLLCAALCLIGCHTDQTAGSSEPAVSSVNEESTVDTGSSAEAQTPEQTKPAPELPEPQMISYNSGLEMKESLGKNRTTYQIFPYSFRDSDGDGIGDISGIVEQLDYIADMGFDQLWLTPVHPSGTYHKYDVDDYYAIDPAFGTLADYERLLEECHARGIKVLLDLVLNHTSSSHPWFTQAADYLKELPEGWDIDPSYCKYAEYYNFRREPAEGYAQLPDTGWYYEARFWSEMPDLNLASENVRAEIRDIMSYWLEKGVDGFRLDAVTSYITGDPAANTEFLRWLVQTGRELDPDCYFVGEAWTDRAHIAELYQSGIDSLFNFPFAGPEGIIRSVLNGSIKASDLPKAMINADEVYRAANPDYTDAPFYTNHDMARSAGYYGQDKGPVTKMAYAVDLLMSGNAFMYYGEELGMKGSGKDENKRAPMYWSEDPEAQGMCAGPPEMDEVAMKFPSLREQEKDPMSLYHWFREVIHVRRAFPAISAGRTEELPEISDDQVCAFRRTVSDDAGTDPDAIIVMNLGGRSTVKDISSAGEGLTLAAVLNTNEEEIALDDTSLTLPAYSIAVLTN